MTFQVEIHIRGIRKLSKEQQKYIGRWIKERGQQFKKEDLTTLASKFSYRLMPFHRDNKS